MRITGLFAAIALAASLLLNTVAAADTTLRISLQLPIESHLGQNLLLFEKEVEEKSAGAIDIEIFDSAQLYKDSDVPAAVGSGLIEMGVVSLARYVGEVPAVDVFYQPFLFESEEKVRAAVSKDSPVRAPLDIAIAGTGSTVLWWQPYGGAIMLSTGSPVKSPAEVAGKKVGVFAKTPGDFVSAIGGAPTLISGPEQYLAYQRGTVDFGMARVSDVKSLKLWEVMDTISVTYHAVIEFVVVVNSDFWNELPAEHRKIIEAAAANAEADVRDRVSRLEAAAYIAAKENGMNVYKPSAEEMEAWRRSSQPVYEDFIRSSGFPGIQVLEAALHL